MRILFVLLLAGCQAANPLSRKPDQDTSQETQVLTTDLLGQENTGDIILYAVPTIGLVENKLIGGSPADRADWPASFTTSHSNSRCTGTLIGEKVLQLAAHCVGNGRSASLTSAGKTYSGVCSHSPKYRTDSTADYALCKMSEVVPVKWYERVKQDADPIQKGDRILLAGMGCTQPGGGGGSNDVFRVGEATITRMPDDNRSNDIVTNAGAALCFGDSGGAAFWKDPNGLYHVVGINSRGDIRSVSYLSSTFTADAKSFYGSWMQANAVKICGISADAPNCRGSNDPQPQSPVPEWCKATFSSMDKCVFGTPRDSVAKPEFCREKYSEFFACQAASEQE